MTGTQRVTRGEKGWLLSLYVTHFTSRLVNDEIILFKQSSVCRSILRLVDFFCSTKPTAGLFIVDASWNEWTVFLVPTGGL